MFGDSRESESVYIKRIVGVEKNWEARLLFYLVNHFLLNLYALIKFIHRSRKSADPRLSGYPSTALYIHITKTFSRKTRSEWMLSLVKGNESVGKPPLFITFVASVSSTRGLFKFTTLHFAKCNITIYTCFTRHFHFLNNSYSNFNRWQNCYSTAVILNIFD